MEVNLEILWEFQVNLDGEALLEFVRVFDGDEVGDFKGVSDEDLDGEIFSEFVGVSDEDELGEFVGVSDGDLDW